jgi:hypothetical protein
MPNRQLRNATPAVPPLLYQTTVRIVKTDLVIYLFRCRPRNRQLIVGGVGVDGKGSVITRAL